MDFELSDEQQMLREVTRSMLATHCTPELVRATHAGDQDHHDKLWARGAELGWLGIAVPEEQDGAGMGVVELVLVAEELGRSIAPGPYVETALVAHAAAAGGASAEIVSGLVCGELRGAVVVVGSERLVHAAGAADWLLVITDDRAALVEAATATRSARRTLDETRRWYAVGDLPEGITVASGPAASHLRDVATLLVAADALGVGETLAAMTVDYACAREQFGRPIGSFQVVKHKAADMLAALKGLRAAVAHAAMTLDARAPGASLAVSIAKAYASEQIPALAGQALQTHGGIGFTWEHDLHLFLRRAKVDEAFLGDADHHHDRIARLLA